MAVQKPTKLPVWDANETNIAEPPSTNQSDGWQVDSNGIPQKPPFQYHNYMWNLQYKWIEYLDAEKANINGDSSVTFKVADADNDDEAVNKSQLDLKANKSGDTFTGDIVIDKNLPALKLNDAQNVDTNYWLITDANGFLNLQQRDDSGTFLNNIFQVQGNLCTFNYVLSSNVSPSANWHLTRKDYVDGTKSKSSNGYQKLPGGIIFQWGVNTTSSSGTVINFPVTFPNACLQVVVSDNSSSIDALASATSFNTTDYTGYNSKGHANSWFAIGY